MGTYLSIESDKSDKSYFLKVSSFDFNVKDFLEFIKDWYFLDESAFRKFVWDKCFTERDRFSEMNYFIQNNESYDLPILMEGEDIHFDYKISQVDGKWYYLGDDSFLAKITTYENFPYKNM